MELAQGLPGSRLPGRDGAFIDFEGSHDGLSGRAMGQEREHLADEHLVVFSAIKHRPVCGGERLAARATKKSFIFLAMDAEGLGPFDALLGAVGVGASGVLGFRTGSGMLPTLSAG